MKKAFTLIELSIVLIIIGLLVGGVLVGKDLIEAAKQRQLLSEWQGYQQAIYAYNLKYDAIPGDDPNAVANLGATNNGNRNGIVEGAFYGGALEVWNFWEHLALAGLAKGTFTSAPGAGGPYDTVLGENIPISGYRNDVGVATRYLVYNRHGVMPWQQFFIYGLDSRTNGLNQDGVFLIEFARSLDRKADDDVANNGRVRVRAAEAFYGTTNCTTGAAPNYVYGTSTTAVCSLLLAVDLP